MFTLLFAHVYISDSILFKVMEQLLTEQAGHRVKLETPRRGDKASLTETACLNAREEVQRATTQTERRNKTLEWLQRTLELPAQPQRIEAL